MQVFTTSKVALGVRCTCKCPSEICSFFDNLCRTTQQQLTAWIINHTGVVPGTTPTSGASDMQVSVPVPPESPVKFLTNLVISYGELIRCVDRIQDVYGEEFKVNLISLRSSCSLLHFVV